MFWNYSFVCFIESMKIRYQIWYQSKKILLACKLSSYVDMWNRWHELWIFPWYSTGCQTEQHIIPINPENKSSVKPDTQADPSFHRSTYSSTPPSPPHSSTRCWCWTCEESIRKFQPDKEGARWQIRAKDIFLSHAQFNELHRWDISSLLLRRKKNRVRKASQNRFNEVTYVMIHIILRLNFLKHTAKEM